MRTCIICQVEKSLDDFESYKTTKGFLYIRKKCKKCKDQIDYLRTKNNGRYERRKLRNRKQRHNPKHRSRYIVQDAKWSDKARGFVTDLDRVFVDDLIKNGCSYCGETEIKIGVDRIDNERGHTRDNVVSACTRCNFIRRNMPHDVWMMLVPAVRDATQKGMMTKWNYGFRRHYEKNKMEVEKL